VVSTPEASDVHFEGDVLLFILDGERGRGMSGLGTAFGNGALGGCDTSLLSYYLHKTYM
jgi:hypothetical protein